MLQSHASHNLTSTSILQLHICSSGIATHSIECQPDLTELVAFGNLFLFPSTLGLTDVLARFMFNLRNKFKLSGNTANTSHETGISATLSLQLTAIAATW